MAVTPERMAEGKLVFDSLVRHLSDIKLSFSHEKREDRYVIKFNLDGDDLPMRFFLYVDPRHRIITLHSPLPVTFHQSRRDLACKAICAINFRLTDGDFQMDPRDGEVLFNMSNCYAGSHLSDEVFDYMLAMSVSIVDEFNDKLLMLSRGLLDMDDLMKSLNY